jgi:hypothetical protein
MELSSWIFLKDGKPALNKPPPSQNGWLVIIGAVQHVWRMLKKAGFKYLETQDLNQDLLENTWCYLFALWFKQQPNCGTVCRCPED